jgi:hypothetical protein
VVLMIQEKTGRMPGSVSYLRRLIERFTSYRAPRHIRTMNTVNQSLQCFLLLS